MSSYCLHAISRSDCFTAKVRHARGARVAGRLTSCSPNVQSIPKQPLNVSDETSRYVIGKERQTRQVWHDVSHVCHRRRARLPLFFHLSSHRMCHFLFSRSLLPFLRSLPALLSFLKVTVFFVKVTARAAFCSRPGFSFLAADFRQIEFRLLAHLSNDDNLTSLFSAAESSDVFTDLTSTW